jgi:glutathione synthase
MRLITPDVFHNVLVRNGAIAYSGDCVCELGVFSASLGEEDRVVGEGGFILRCKAKETLEGGVAAGYAFLSSPELV